MSVKDTSGFAERVERVLDGTADREDLAAVDRRISADPRAAQYYVDVLMIHLALSRSSGFPADDSGIPACGHGFDQLFEELTPTDTSSPRASAWPSADQEKVEQIRRYAQRQLDAFLQQQHELDRTYRGATGGSWDPVEAGHEALRRLGAFTKVGTRAVKVLAVWSLVFGTIAIVAGYFYSHRIVATVVDSVHTRWTGDTNPAELAPGWRRLEEGFARIAFRTGAEVILQAPCEINLRSSNGMVLESGRMTAKVPRDATGFTVTTPASTVVDYGTEFGLLVGTRGESEVHVFAGAVGLSQPQQSREARFQRLSTGHTAQVDLAGSVRLDTTSNRPGLFVQDMPAGDGFGIPGRRLDLADIVSGGNGFGTGRPDSMICTGSGQFTMGVGNVWLDADSGGAYVPVHSLPYVDGVFIPDGSEGSVIVSSAGHRFNVGPDTDGMMHNGFVSAGVYRHSRLFRVDFSQNGDVEPGWMDWNTGTRLENARLSRTFESDFDREFTLVFDSVDTRNRGQVDSAVPLHDLLDDDFKESGAVVMRLHGLDPGTYLITTYHHDPLEDSKDSDGTINISVADARGERIVAQRFWQSWGPNPKVVASATFTFESDGREIVITFKDNDDATHNEAHINGFELGALRVAGMTPDAAPASSVPELDGQVFGSRVHPAVYMHANVGITFDLDAMREALAGARIMAFQARCGMMTDAHARSTGGSSRAVFWVLVDGEMRFRRIEEHAGTAALVNVELNDHDRFLTLATTDGGDGHSFDRCFFGDPALSLEPPR